ncbi:MAG TPA: hypothetical protein VFS20_08365 [Longimicrobium sp.]|nr:hypothetical protein [Longimicrobium sp.]
MTKRMVLVLAAASAVAAPAAAQQRAQIEAAELRLQRASALAAPEAPQGRDARAPAGRTALHVLGGALIGAGAGYLASQVAWSDWDKTSNSEFAGRRMSFAMGGSAVGALAGLVLGRGSSGPAHTVRAQQPPTNAMGAMVTAEELRGTAVTNVYEFLQGNRPSWLRGRGEGVLRAGRPVAGSPRATPEEESGSASARPAQGPQDQVAASPAPKVYLDGGFVGDVNQLRQILVSQTERIEYLDAAAATYRFGSGHASGAILVTSLGR